MSLAPCWRCGERPVIEEKYGNGFNRQVLTVRFVCPVCRHQSSSRRRSVDEAQKLWNQVARIQDRRQRIRERGLS